MATRHGPPSDDAVITWIHLSDFHAGQRGEAAWNQIDVALERNVREMAEDLGVPDVVLFTGDLANWGGRDATEADEYAKVDRLLDRLDGWLGQEVPVFAVPGNHDLVRPKRAWDYAAFKNYEHEPEFHEALWKGDLQLRALLDQLFPHYTAWAARRVHGSLRKAGWEPHVSPRMPGDLSVVIAKGGLRLGLVGLNSAWTHLSDEAEGRLQLPAEQLQAALPPAAEGNPLDWFRGNHASFLLTHHPPGWLSERAQVEYPRDVYAQDRFALALYGHMHDAQSERIARAGMPERTFYQSPSLFGLEHYGTDQESRAIGYTWGRLTARSEVRIWPQKAVRRQDGSVEFDRDQGFGRARDGGGGTVLVYGQPAKGTIDAPSSRQTSDTKREPAWQDPIPHQELQRYLKRAEARHQDVPLIGFKTKARLSMQLHELYVPLRAVLDRHGRGREAFGSEEIDQWCMGPEAELRQEGVKLADAFHRACALNRRGLVLLGDPGSGKTTHLKQVLLKVVREGPESMGLPTGTVPLFLPLRNFDASSDLAALIQAETKAPGVKPDFGQRLCERGRLLLLLDGLDEVASEQERAEVSRWIETLLHDMPESHVLVSCRYAGYSGNAELSATYLELHLRPFDDEQMRTYVTRWYALVERELCTDPGQAAENAKQGARELLGILESSEFSSVSRLYQMTRNPLLLTTLCLVHHDLGRLPHARAKLYEESVAVLLERWRHRLGGATPLSADEAVEVLQPVAKWLHEQRRKRATKAELVEPVTQGLAKLRHVRLDAESFLRKIRDDSGLLTGWGADEYGFMHLGFQEYLAARRLRIEGFKDPQVFEALAKHFGDSWWQEVILLMLAQRDPSVFEEFMRHVVRQLEFERWAGSEMMALVFDEAAEISAAPFLEVLRWPDHEGTAEQRIAAAEILRRRIPMTQDVTKEVMQGLMAKVVNGVLAMQRGAGRALATIEAPRGGVELVLVPGGSFTMGSPEDEEGRDVYNKEYVKQLGHHPESPRHRVELSSFYLARTPVTNAQYAEFLKTNPKVEKPGNWGDRQYNQPEQPVVGVSWYEAKAYCDWAGLSLPTEAQWEYACRAGTTTRYHSGDGEEDLARVGWYRGNSGERLHGVGELEPNEYGLYDMHGNVWEWCLDAHGPYTTEARPRDGLRHEPEGVAVRVMRGGCFFGDAVFARSAFRGGGPGLRWRLVGFRPSQGHP